MKWYPTRQTKKILNKYSILPKINSRTYEAIRKDTAEEIFVETKLGDAYCDSCESRFMLPKSRHLSTVKCPSCKKEMKVIHMWRRQGPIYSTRHIVVPYVMDNHTVILRYVMASRSRGYHHDTLNINEVARLCMDFDADYAYPLEVRYDSEGNPVWKIGLMNYFRERNMGMGWYLRAECVLVAEPHRNFYKEMAKLDFAKYLNLKDIYSDRIYINSQVVKWHDNASVIEKLQKVGLNSLANELLNCYQYRKPHIDKSQTSLIKMLGLNKVTWAYLREMPTIDALNYLQHHENATRIEWEDARELKFDIYRLDFIYELKLKYGKTMAYLKKHSKDSNELQHFASDYSDYIRTLKELDYPFDDAYLFPKDFEKEDKRIHAEKRAREDAKILAEKQRQNKLIKDISDGLRKTKDYEEFIKGSNGLLVYVPESAEDLLKEGQRLHNCIGSYIDRVAEGKTLVFFVRKIEAPDEAFVAFEYVNGEVVQCRYDHNEPVKDNNIISFVDAFAERLRRNNVLYKAA